MHSRLVAILVGRASSDANMEITSIKQGTNIAETGLVRCVVFYKENGVSMYFSMKLSRDLLNATECNEIVLDIISRFAKKELTE